MGKSYEEKEVISRLEKDIAADKIYLLFKKNYINYSGKPTGNKNEYYFEVLAKYLLDHKVEELYKSVKVLPRKQSYKMDDHFVNKNQKKEKWLAKLLLNFKLDSLGDVIDFEMPIKSSKLDKKVGEVDLLAYNKNEKILSLVELKLRDNPDTMLHTILQICTYYHQIDEKKLIQSFKLPSTTKIQKAILIFKESPQYEQFKSKYIKQLVKELDINVFILDFQVSPLL
ncbi:MAG: hypothetical protein FWF38_01975 [Spirochaetaceae bacterium]|nr:hypothetical protein [Spirochaetaceae bacterium]